MRGYTSSPNFAWSGWRLRNDGGPVGGQYHGYIGPDSAGWENGLDEIGGDPNGGDGWLKGDSRSGWSSDWGGTALREGQTVSDYVYRSPGEVQPRPNASGGVNTIRSLQTERRPGYAEAPGNYRYLGGSRLGLMMTREGPGTINVVRRMPGPGTSTGVLRRPGDGAVTHPVLCPAWGCGNPPGVIFRTLPGSTQMVAQPPPPQAPGGTLVQQTIPPVSPAPAPTVAASPADYLPSNGQVVPGITPGASTNSIMDWLTASSIWSAVPNGVLVGAGLLLAFSMSGRGRR